MINKQWIRLDWKVGELKYMRDGFGEALVEMGEERDDLVVLTADLGSSLRLEGFKNRFPERYFNVGVAEQNMVGVAAGLAAEGWLPVTTSFGVFSPGRSWDQIRVSVSYSKAKVKVVGSHGGVATGEDGATHQALEDVAIMQVLPEMVVVAPCDYNQAKLATRAMIEHENPVYLRLVRPKSLVLTKEVEFKIGKAYVYREGKDATILAYGLQVEEALIAAEELAMEKIEVEVINVSTIKPLDEKTVLESVGKTRRVVVAEDHQIIGGLGSEVARLLVKNQILAKFEQVGMNGFGESGDWRKLYQKYGLGKEAIKEKIRLML